MDQKRLGKNGPDVSTVGLGCMGLSGGYGPVDEAESIAVIHAAIDAGITYFDTGDFYAMGHNEMLLGRALKGRRDQVKIGVKFGALRGPDGAFIGFDSRPVAARAFLAYSLRRLDTDYIDLYQAARVDPSLPYEETIGGIADLITAGYVRHLGVSEVSAATLRKAQAVHTVAALQIEYSLMSRGIEDAILPAARELGISITAYGILSRGLIGGTFGRGDKAAGDTRGHYPRFSDENLKRNRTMVQALDKIAAKRNVTAAQIAIAWVMAQGPAIIPLIGARTRTQLASALAALEIRLDPQELAAIEKAVPWREVAGERYGAPQMRMLDSEKTNV